jgi:hypothetical protein
MGNLFSTPKYTESESEKQLRLDREERIKVEKEEQEDIQAKETKRKKRMAKGVIGMRSLFSRAGGRGFYAEGKEIE